jgi:hypothetical protein
MEFTGTAVAAIFLAIALIVMWRHRWQGSRFTVVLMLFAGFGVVGIGWIGAGLGQLGEWLGGLATEGTARLFGVSAPIVVLAAAVTWLVVDVKDRTIHPVTPWLALALPSLLATVGGVYIGAGDTALSVAGEGLASAAGWLGSLG